MRGYCKYCDSLIEEEDILRDFDPNTHELIWYGCLACYKKRREQVVR